MKITRNVILDLLPLYAADEVSADTRILIDSYLETDPELANVAKRLSALELPGDIPVALSPEDRIKTFRRARRRKLLHTIIIAAIMTLMVFITLFTFFSPP